MDLEAILSPISIPVFLDQYFGRAFLHVPGSRTRFAGVNSEDAVRSLERELEAPVRTQEHSGFGLARRERDGVLLQIAGDSACKVYGNGQDAAEPALWDGVVEQGDALYIPRGWWLAVAPGGSQIGFDIENPTGADLLEWVVKHIKEHPAFRADIPRFADPAAKADYAAGLRRTLAGIFRRPALLEAFRRETNLGAPPTLPSSNANPGGDPLLEIATPRKIRIKRADHATLLLVAMGKRLAFPEETAAMLQYLADKAPVSRSEFYRTFEGEFDREELSDFLSVLEKEGMIGLREPRSS